MGNTGAAYIYEREQGGTLWSRHSKLIARDIGANSNFAAKLALYGTYVCMYVLYVCMYICMRVFVIKNFKFHKFV